MELSRLHVHLGSCTVRPFRTAIPLQNPGALSDQQLSPSCDSVRITFLGMTCPFSGMLCSTSADVVCQMAPIPTVAQLR